MITLNHIEEEAISHDNPYFQIWDNDDSRTMIWLCGSMTTKISRNYMVYSIAYGIWEDLGNTFSMRHDIFTC